MRRYWRLILVLAVLTAPGSIRAVPGHLAPAEAAVAEQEDLIPGEILVRWREAPCAACLQVSDQILKEAGSEGGASRLEVPAGRERELATALQGRPEVAWAQPNFVRHLAETANDPRFGEQWALQRIQAPAAWDLTEGVPSVVVAVIDTGVDLKHPDLDGRLADGFNFLEPEAPPQDDYGHGTHAAGTIAATINNNIGIAGVAPGVMIMPLKALDRRGTGRDTTVAEAIHYAVDHGAWVINMSFGGADQSPILEEAVDYATAMGTVLVVAAGNDGRSAPSYPAASDAAIAVAATNVDDTRPAFTNFGTWIDIAAPGQSILSTFWERRNGSTYRMVSGTSMAAPHVAGVVALMFSLKPSLTIAEIDATLKKTADPVNGTGIGAGRVNAARAVAAVSGNEIPSSAPAVSPTLPVPSPPPTGLPSNAVPGTGAPVPPGPGQGSVTPGAAIPSAAATATGTPTASPTPLPPPGGPGPRAGATPVPRLPGR